MKDEGKHHKRLGEDAFKSSGEKLAEIMIEVKGINELYSSDKGCNKGG